MKRVYHDDADVKTIYHTDTDGNTLERVERWQDCEAIIENNKDWQTRGKQTGDFRLVAQIPNIIIERWLNEEAARGNRMKWSDKEFDLLIKRKLKDPDWAWLRTA